MRGGLLGALGALAAGFVGVAAVVADWVLAFVGDVLGDLGQEIQRAQDLKIAGDPAEEIFGNFEAMKSASALRKQRG